MKVYAYIDGFNLYFGLKEKEWRQYYWLNVHRLSQSLLRFNQQLVVSKYFTSRVIDSPSKQKRQLTYIEALETIPELKVIYGRYQLNPRQCPQCGFTYKIPSEKMTDVNIATEMFSDAVKDRFDIALLISADADLVPIIKAIRETFADKRVIIAFPPGRSVKPLQDAANVCLHISRSNISRSLLPSTIRKPDGYILECPLVWK